MCALPPGSYLKNNSYRIQRLLGQGGFGAVYLADDLILNHLCAIKEGFDNSPGAQAQFEVESRILANLNHPNLPRVTDNFIDPVSGLQYLVMEYVEGVDLGTLLQKYGPIPEDKVRNWILQVLEAVAYLHAYQPRPVIHRDIKPDNMRLLPDGRVVKLVDFGIAKIGGVSYKTRGVARCITHGFSPPEQYGSGTDTYSDVYALGASLYNLLTNVLPADSIDLAYGGAQLVPPRQLNPAVSAEMEQIVMTAMQLRPELRFANAGEMLTALRGRVSSPIMISCQDCGQSVRSTARFCPNCGAAIRRTQPFVFRESGYQASAIPELIRGIDVNWTEALSYFISGEMETWLQGLGQEGQALADISRRNRAAYPDASAALEAFLEEAFPNRSRPILKVQPEMLDYGVIRPGDRKVLALSVENTGHGYLHGEVEAQAAFIQVHPKSFGCLAGSSQQVEIEVKTDELAGTLEGAGYSGKVVVTSNRGRQTVPVQVTLIEEPQIAVTPPEVDLGGVEWHKRLEASFQIANTGGGILAGEAASEDPWLMIAPETSSFTLNKGDAHTVRLKVDTTFFKRRGIYSGRAVLTGKEFGRIQVNVKLVLDAPVRVSPTESDTAAKEVDDLIQLCDRYWDRALGWLRYGHIETFLRFIGNDALADLACQASREEDLNQGLELLLQKGGAPAPEDYVTNIKEVLNQLGFGLLPKQSARPNALTLKIQNTSRRGYLWGVVKPLAPWLSIPEPHFGCLPGETAEIRIDVNYSARKFSLFSTNTELFEILF